MKHGSTEVSQYRNGDWGPAYVIEAEHIALGVMRLRPGDEMANHIHRTCDESFVVLEGEAELWTDCRDQHLITVGDVHRCVPGEMHYFRNSSGAAFRCLFIKTPASPGDTVVIPWQPGQPAPQHER